MHSFQRHIPDTLCPLEFVEIHQDRIDENWFTIQAKLGGTPPILSDWGKDVLRNGLGHHVKTVLIEPFYICKDHRNLYGHFYSKKFHPPSPYCARLHFFSIPPPASEREFKCDPEPFKKAYMGYSVIRPVAERCLGRTVIDPDSIGMDIGRKTFCLRTSFRVHIGGVEFVVKGYPYVSQDTDATVCAHSALWSVCRYFSERYSVYGEIRPFDLVEMTGNSKGRTFPYRGMTYEDYSAILSQFGAHPVILRTKFHHTDKKLISEAWNNVCTYVESGYPVLASLYPINGGDGGHVVALVGHTLDVDRPLPMAQDFVDSTVFFNRLVVVDDNCFPYQVLGSETDTGNYAQVYSQKFSLDSMMTAVCPLPEKAFMPAEGARETCMRLLDQADIRKRLDTIGKPPWICRLLMSTGSSFRTAKLQDAREIGANDLTESVEFVVSSMNLPHFVWIMQLAPVETYKQLEAVAEIVIDATAGKCDKNSLYIRIGNELLPNVQVLSPNSATQQNNKGTVFGGSAQTFPLYRHNLGKQKRETT